MKLKGLPAVRESTVLSCGMGPLTGPPKLSARAWIVYDAMKDETLFSHEKHERREIASLTKLMTAYTALNIVKKLDLNMLTAKVDVPLEASLLPGTSAGLSEGDELNVWDMLHALLLPSGNDAAYSIAEFFGYLLVSMGLPPLARTSSFVDLFVAEMNRNAKLLALDGTHYANPHGLQNSLNKSTALDVAKLSSICMRMPLFSEIVKKPKYYTLGINIDGKKRNFVWTNTNRLLTKDFNGVKTGITPSAGPCLSSSYKTGSCHLIIVVLGCKTPDHRWHEIVRLRDMAVGTSKSSFKTSCSPGRSIILRNSYIKPSFNSLLGALPRKHYQTASLKTFFKCTQLCK